MAKYPPFLPFFHGQFQERTQPLQDTQGSIETLVIDLQKAVTVEREHRYSNVQGRRQTFDQFIQKTLRQLSRTLPEAAPEHWQPLLQRFTRYPWMDMGGRMAALETLDELILALKQALVRPALPKGGERLQWDLQETAATAGQNTESPGGSSATKLETKLASRFDTRSPVETLRGVGPRVAKLLHALEIHTAGDLLYYFPRRYLDYQHRCPIRSVENGQDVTIVGTVRSASVYDAKRRQLTILKITVADDTGRAEAHWFFAGSSRALAHSTQARYPKGAEVMISGKARRDATTGVLSFERPTVEVLQEAASSPEDDADGGTLFPSPSLHAGRIVPVYALTEGLHLKSLRKLIHQTLQESLPGLQDPLPSSIQAEYNLQPLAEALQQVHFPDSLPQAEAARRRLVFDELFYLQLHLANTRARFKQQVQGLRLHRQAGGFVDQLLASLPFALTGAQQRVFAEICQDLESPEPMYRLLHGDVGSGKTVIAALTLLMAVENGYQGAIMAPTEILAEQHYQKFVNWFTPLGVRVALVVGKTGTKERRALRQGLLNGQIHVAIGTHALIQEDVAFRNLGLVVVDEQHRFGVRQRARLRDKGEATEMLTMTATPIPRTLTMTLHGDLDVSTLDERPPGRTPIHTQIIRPSELRTAYGLIRQELARGRQAYVVLPLIEESETLSAKAATTEAAHLQTEIFPEHRVGLLHGKLSAEEKEAVMREFAQGKTHILVSTTVVEVGVDVPNATLMMIENADRFGLAQLHQLRGRVGRGQHASTCLLVARTQTSAALERLQWLVEYDNGFLLAEKDLEIRGPGDYLGTRQSGLPDFLLTDLVRDQAILQQARAAAQALFVQHTDWALQYPALAQASNQHNQGVLSVLGAG